MPQSPLGYAAFGMGGPHVAHRPGAGEQVLEAGNRVGRMRRGSSRCGAARRMRLGRREWGALGAVLGLGLVGDWLADSGAGEWSEGEVSEGGLALNCHSLPPARVTLPDADLALPEAGCQGFELCAGVGGSDWMRAAGPLAGRGGSPCRVRWLSPIGKRCFPGGQALALGLAPPRGRCMWAGTRMPLYVCG